MKGSILRYFSSVAGTSHETTSSNKKKVSKKRKGNQRQSVPPKKSTNDANIIEISSDEDENIVDRKYTETNHGSTVARPVEILNSKPCGQKKISCTSSTKSAEKSIDSERDTFPYIKKSTEVSNDESKKTLTLSEKISEGSYKTADTPSLISDKENKENVDVEKPDTDDSVVDEQPEDASSETVPYYLRDFRLVINTVLGIPDDAKLFECEEDSIWIKAFQGLDKAAQQLYVRLYHRKPSWLPIHKISYSEIPDISAVLKLLAAEGLLMCSESQGHNVLSLREILLLIPAPSVKAIGKSLHLQAYLRGVGRHLFWLQVNCDKLKIVNSILTMCEKQRSISFGRSMEDIVRKKALKVLGLCYKLAPAPKKIFNRMLLVFDVTKGTVDDSEFSLVGTSQPPFYGKHPQLSSILMAGMGRTVYPTYVIDRPSAVFQTRQDLLEYETVYQLQLDIINACEAADFQLASEICREAKAISLKLSEESKQHAISLPHFLRRFTAYAVCARIKSLQVEVLQKTKEYDEASKLLYQLLEQKHFCVSRRGYWTERLALNLDQHLHDPVASWNVIQNSVKDSNVRGAHKVALAERADKLQNNKKIKALELTSSLSFGDFLKAREVTIVGRILPKRMQTGKARFMAKDSDAAGDNVLLCSVEELALAHYKTEGYESGMHGEGGIFSCIFCLLMWDIIFMPGVPDVFRTSYQTHPLDLHTDDFYKSRKFEIDARLKKIRDWESDDFSASQQITDTWEKHFNVACSGMNWERFSSPEQVLDLAKCIGGPILSSILEILSINYRHRRGGLPDLTVWSPSRCTYKLVEVKGPGDRLQNNQKMWMHDLVTLGVNVEVCHVSANASRKLQVS